MEYPDGDWKYCSCGESYYVFDDMLDPGICSECRSKIARREKKERQRVKRLEAENIRLRKKLKEKS